MQLSNMIQEALNKLPPLQRDLMRALLTCEDDASSTSLAEQMGLTLSAMRLQLSQARLRLQELCNLR